MGMYDELTVKTELPLPEEVKHLNIDWKAHRFQTKDLENCLVDYVLTEQGKLVERVVDREYIEYTEEEKKDKNRKPWNIWKDVIEKNERFVDTNFHGTIFFYAFEEFDDKHDFWLDYKAYFVYGQLDKIELVEFKKSKSYKITNKEIEEQYKLEAKRPWNVFKRLASRVGWRWFWKKISNLCQHLSKTFNHIYWFILRNFL